MLVPGGADDVRPVRGEDGWSSGDYGFGNVLLEGNRGMIIREQWTEGGVGEQDV